jgi:hypothetical protein
MLITGYIEIEKLHNLEYLQCMTNPILWEQHQDDLEKWEEIMRLLKQIIDQKYPYMPQTEDEPFWNNIEDQTDFPNLGFEA